MKKTLVVLGAGTGGTMLSNIITRKFNSDKWQVILVDKEPAHFYQSGYLGLVFGIRKESQIRKPKKKLIPDNVDLIFSDVEAILPEKNTVLLRKDNQKIEYDHLVIATGADIYPEENAGLLGSGWQNSIHNFYTFDGARNLHDVLNAWQGGRLVVNIAELPVKCPVAPLEFLFLADQFLSEAGLRSKVELVYTLPSPEVFSHHEIGQIFESMISEKNIHMVSDFYLKDVDPDTRTISSYTGDMVEYDLLVSVPTNMGAKVIGRSGLGNEFRFVPVDMHTLQHEEHENIWAIGDAADLPCPKTASAIHNMADTVAENITLLDAGKPLVKSFLGDTKCLVAVGDGRSVLLAFSYTQPPATGKYPIPGIGPFSNLRPTKFNYLAKYNLYRMYWNLFLPAIYKPPRYQHGD